MHGRAVLTGRLDEPEISDGAVVVDGASIVAVGPSAELRRNHRPDRELGGPDRIILPGLISAHQHGAGVSSVQLGCPDQPFESWLMAMFGIEPLDIGLDTQYHAVRLLENGITGTIHSHYTRDPSRYSDEVGDILAAYRTVGMRVAFAPCYMDRNLLTYGEDQAFLGSLPADLAASAARITGAGIDSDTYFGLVQTLANDSDPAWRQILFGPVAPQWCSEEMLGRIGDAVGRGTGAHLHLLETPAQRVYLDEAFGRPLFEALQDFGLLRPWVSFAHGVWLRAGEMDQLASCGATVVVSPGCNLRLGNGIVDIGSLVRRHVRVAFGTDDMTIADDDDLLGEVRLGVALNRPGGSWMNANVALHAATAAGAQASMFGDLVGSIEAGKRADLVLLDAQRISEPFVASDVSNLELVVARAHGSDVRTVMVDGEIVIDEGRHRSIDRGALGEELAAVARAQAADPARRSYREMTRRLATARASWDAPHAGPTMQPRR